MVLPFLLIGKALKPLAKIKKKAWSAMGSAFKSIKGSVDPMKSFSKIMEILSVIMLPLTYIFTLLASVILKELMPYISDIIDLMDDLGDVMEANAEEVDYLNEYYQMQVEKIEAIIDVLDHLYYYMFEWRGHIEFLTEVFESFLPAIENVTDAIEILIDALVEGYNRLGGGDGDGDGDGGFEWPTWGTGPVGQSNSTSNTVNINLSNSVIDDRAALVRDIVEQVIIRIG